VAQVPSARCPASGAEAHGGTRSGRLWGVSRLLDHRRCRGRRSGGAYGGECQSVFPRGTGVGGAGRSDSAAVVGRDYRSPLSACLERRLCRWRGAVQFGAAVDRSAAVPLSVAPFVDSGQRLRCRFPATGPEGLLCPFVFTRTPRRAAEQVVCRLWQSVAFVPPGDRAGALFTPQFYDRSPARKL